MSELILFQGDSITDAGRSREHNELLGRGFASMVSGYLGLNFPDRYTFLNRGIAGNKVVDVYARMKADILNLMPDYMSILLGVNDAWREYTLQNGISTEKFEKIYTMLIEEVLEELPDIKIILMEPFALPGSASDATDEKPCFYSDVRADIERNAEAVRRVAEKFNLPFVELQSRFDEVYNPDNRSYWLLDGVHPSSAGHALIAREWLDTFSQISNN